MGEPQFHDYEDEYTDEFDDELDDWPFDCHLDRHGFCGKVGSEECEFECPYRYLCKS